MSDALHELTVTESGRRFRDGTLSPLELTNAYLERIRQFDPLLNTFVEVAADRAVAEAEQAERELRAGRDHGPFHGIPYGLKDIFETAGIRTTAQSRLLENNYLTTDCAVQERMRVSGGVLLGKQSTWEFALGGPSFDLPWPPARNPWDTARSPLGSSSGGAAAIAAALCPAAVGSDTGGSIRSPAAVCGIVGFKPTYGLVSRRGAVAHSFTFDHAGPMAWTVEDCALMLGIMAGHDPGDPASIDTPIPDYAAALDNDLEGLRIGLVRHWYTEDYPAHPSVIQAMDTSAAVFRELGFDVRDVRLPSLREFAIAKAPITMSEQYAIHEQDLKTRPQDFGRSLRYRLFAGALIRSAEYIQGMRLRAKLCAEVAVAVRDIDILITATTFESAPPLVPDEPPTIIGADVPSLTAPFNLTGQPALSVCNGFDDQGLPLGLQIAGRVLEDATVLAVGHAFQQAIALNRPRPSPAS